MREGRGGREGGLLMVMCDSAWAKPLINNIQDEDTVESILHVHTCIYMYLQFLRSVLQKITVLLLS